MRKKSEPGYAHPENLFFTYIYVYILNKILLTKNSYRNLSQPPIMESELILFIILLIKIY